MSIPAENPIIIPAETAFNNFLLKTFRVDTYLDANGQPEAAALCVAKPAAIINGRWVESNQPVTENNRYSTRAAYKAAETDPDVAAFLGAFMQALAAFNAAKKLV